MKIMLRYLRPFRSLVAFVLILGALNMGFSMYDPVIFGKIIDLTKNYEASPDGYQPFFWNFAGIALKLLGLSIAVAMASRIAKNFQDYFLSVVIQKFGAKIFTDGLRQAMKLPYQEFEDQRSGETLNVLQKVRTDTERFMTLFVNMLYSVLIGVIFVTIFAIRIHPMLPIIYFGGIAILIVFSNMLSKKIRSIQKNILQQTNALAGSTTESLRNIELIKSLGLTTQEVDRLNKNTFKILGLELIKVKKIRSIAFLQGTFVNTLRQVILFALLWVVFHKDLTSGQLVTMQFFSFFIFGPLQEIGSILQTYREAEVSMQNFDDLMNKQPEHMPSTPSHLTDVKDLRFEQVRFKHQTAQHPAIDGISFQVKKGETIAFVGPSGSGKSTLMKLLVGLYRPNEGKIFYNGLDETQIHYDDLRNKIGFVTQDTQLFSGTIRENLMFVNENATEEDMMNALDKASCRGLLQRAEKGVDTVIGEGGLKLSGGERQRLSIARALIRHPQLLIFDEATSALDSITEEEITTTIRDISNMASQITVMIAHRLSTIMHADRIYVLERGRIVETGSHDSLIEEKGLYYAMWRQQIGERKFSRASAPLA